MPNLDIFEDIDAELNHFNELYPGYNSSSNSGYFTYDKLNNLLSNDTFNFSLFHLNVRSLFPKHDEILSALYSAFKDTQILGVAVVAWWTIVVVAVVAW